MADSDYELRKWPHDQLQSKAHGLALGLGLAAGLATIALAIGIFGRWTLWLAIPVAGSWIWACVLLATKGRLRCPQCSRRFRGLDWNTDDRKHVTYRCPKCRVIWVTEWIDDKMTC
jgi:hypothetical protein